MKLFKRSRRVEDPDRLKRFLDELGKTDWQNQGRESLNKIFTALNDLIYYEVIFYYRARKKQRLFSIATRGLALFLGTMGILAPLFAGADPVLFRPVAAYGYPLLALAAAALFLNRMFGATGGHIRYVTAQLELERTITKYRLAWAQWSARTAVLHIREPQLAEAFELFNSFVDHSYKIIQEETTVWGKSVSEALQEYESRLSWHRSAAVTVSPEGLITASGSSPSASEPLP